VLVLLLGCWFGRGSLFQHADHAALFARQAVALLVFSALSILCAKTAGQREGLRQSLAVTLLAVFVVAQTIFAWDFLMWLEPEWTSTLFGGFYIVSSLYSSLAILTLLTVLASKTGQHPDATVFHNLGKMLFSFSLLWVYFVWSQYLTIWYGNLPAETNYLIARSKPPWNTLTVMVMITCFVLPFVALLPRAAKRSGAVLAGVSVIVVLGLWAQAYVLAMPSLVPALEHRFGVQEAMASAGLAALLALTQMVKQRTTEEK
jgi:hypothetical protein